MNSRRIVGLYEWYKAKTFCCAFFAAAMLTMVAAATIVRFPPVRIAPENTLDPSRLQSIIWTNYDTHTCIIQSRLIKYHKVHRCIVYSLSLDGQFCNRYYINILTVASIDTQPLTYVMHVIFSRSSMHKISPIKFTQISPKLSSV